MGIDSFIYDGDGRSLSDRLRSKGFVVFVPIVTISMLFALTIFGISLGWLYNKPLDIENHLYSELPLDFLISIFIGVSSFFYKGKRMELKSDVIELDLRDNGMEETSKVFKK